MVHIPFVQTFIGQRIAAVIGDKLGTEVSIGKVNPGFLNRLIIDDVTVLDKERKTMVKVSRMAAKINYYELLSNGRIYISSAQLFGFKGYFYKKNVSADANYQFLVDALTADDTKKTSENEVSVNSIIIRHGSFVYDRYDIPCSPSRFNAGHINVSDISAHISIPRYKSGDMEISVKKLSFKEQSGFDLRNLSFNLALNATRMSLRDINISMPGTELKVAGITADYKSDNGKPIPSTLEFNGEIEPSKFTLSDVSCFMPELKTLNKPLYVSMRFSGNHDFIALRALDITSSDRSIKLGLTARARRDGNKYKYSADVSTLYCNALKIREILEAFKVKDKSVADKAGILGDITCKGHVEGTENTLLAAGTVDTGIGMIHADVVKNGVRIDAELNTDGFDMARLLNDKAFGTVVADVAVKCRDIGDISAATTIDGSFSRFDYNGYRYGNIEINGNFRNKVVEGRVVMDDLNGYIETRGTVDISPGSGRSSLAAVVRNVDLAALGITDRFKGGRLSAGINIDGRITSVKEGLFNGVARIEKLSIESSDKYYCIDSIRVVSAKNSIDMSSSFGHVSLSGDYTSGNPAYSLMNILHSKLPTLCRTYKNTDNNFTIDADIKSLDWLNAFFEIPVSLHSPLRFTANADSRNNVLTVNCNTDNITYKGGNIKAVNLSAYVSNDTLNVAGRFIKADGNNKETDWTLKARAASDMLQTDISWDNKQAKTFKGRLDAVTRFAKGVDNDIDFHVNLNPSEILVGDAVWQVKPAEIIYDNGDLIIDRFAIGHNGQHIKVSGKATKSLSDSITVDLQDIDVNYVLNLVNFHAVDFKGFATGKACVKSVFYEPEFYAGLKVRQFLFEDGSLGDLSAKVEWNKEARQIDIDAYALDDKQARTIISGYVSPMTNRIDLGIKAENTNAAFLESFCGSFMDNVNIRTNGKVRLHGPLDEINLTGLLTVDGSLRIKPLATYYYLTKDTIRFKPDNIVFSADTIRDRNGNTGILSGSLRHRALTRLVYDLDIKTDNLLCYDTKGYGNDTFYGTVYASGDCGIKGGNGQIDIDVNVKPDKNSFIEYNAASPETASDRQFISWNDKTQQVQPDTATIIRYDNAAMSDEERYVDMPSDMRINFLVDMTPDATLRVLMDKATGDCIALNGTGSLRANYFNKGSFNMFGTYLVDHGIYELTIQNIIKKIFSFQQGSSIVFGGDPYDASLNLKAKYTVNGVPLSDLQIGNSFSGNNVKVDCIMNINGTPQVPRVDFDLDLPTLSSDAEQMVRTIINSEEEMNQQVVYLLGVGRFNMQMNNNSASQEERPNQTSLAMQSLLSGTISQQINTLLGGLTKNKNWTFGANISTGNDGFNNAEYEGMLSGRLFNNRLLINGQFGYRDNENATTSFIGDFDINYLLFPNGNMSLKVYNQTNDRYFTKSSLNTQGVGLLMKKEFNSLYDLFGIKRKRKYKTTP